MTGRLVLGVLVCGCLVVALWCARRCEGPPPSTAPRAAELRTVATSSSTGPALRAATAIAKIEDPHELDELARIAASSDPVLIRANAIRALGRLGNRAATGVLGSLLADATQALRIRQEAALALGALDDPSTVPMLVRILKSLRDTHDDIELRLTLFTALGALASTAAREVLQDAAEHAHSQRERLFARRALSTR